jgi:hypothetical protein
LAASAEVVSPVLGSSTAIADRGGAALAMRWYLNSISLLSPTQWFMTPIGSAASSSFSDTK